MAQKKILYLITKSNFGGAQRYVYDLATSLPREMFATSVAVGGDGILIDKLRRANTPTHTLKALHRDISIGKEVSSFTQIIALLRKERPDVLHLNSPKAAGLGALAARISGVPRIVQTIHGWSFNEDRSIVERSLIWFFSWFTVILCHRTIVISKHDLAQGMRMPLVRNRFFHIPLAISPEEFIQRREARTILTEQDPDLDHHLDERWIGTVAELTKNKGHVYGLEAIARVPDVHWVLIGDGELKDQLRHKAEALGIMDRVHFLGFVPDAARYIKAFDMFLLPSVKEGYPYALLEARAAGIPIVATNVGGVSEIVDSSSGRVVPPRSATALEHALSEDREMEGGNAPAPSHIDEMLRSTVHVYTN